MVNYKEILRLNHEGYSQRQIESSVHCSRHTVRDVLAVAQKHNLTWPLDESVTNEQIESILFPERYSSVSMYLEPDYTYIHSELAKRGVTLTLLWNEYVQKAEAIGKKPYMTTQFGDKYRAWARITKATMRIHHKPGDAMQVDWAGDTLPIYDSETGETWAEYIKTYTDNTFVEMTKLYDEGKSVGYELDEEYLETIETEWDSMEAVAKSYGYTVNDYAEMNYGRGVNEKVFKGMYERYYYAFTYAENFAENEEVSADDIDAYYGENAERFDSVSYKTYFASGTAAEGEDVKAAMEEAKAKAEAVLAGTEEAEFTEANYSVKASVSGTYADWLFDEARVAGDKELFETESGYYVVEFVEANDLHYNTVDVRHILVAPEDTSNETAWQEALEAAEEYEAEWKELGGSEENFAEVAAKYSVDSSAANGGLYENVFKGQMVTEFEDWCFDPARKAGDSEIIKTQFGYHIMYFSGVAEEYYSYVVDNAIRGERLNAHIDEIIEGVEVSELFGNRFVGKHYA